MQGRHRSRCLAHKLNNMDPGSMPMEKFHEAQAALLQQILGKMGEGSFIEPPFLPDYGCNVIMGRNCFANFKYVVTDSPVVDSPRPAATDFPRSLTILDTSLVTIGDRVQFGPNVSIFGASHDTSVLSRIKFVEFGLPVVIEDDCWIGGGSTILPGVTIGKGSTVGAGSTVTKSLPPYSVAVGTPARVVRTLPTVEQERADPSNPYRGMPDRQ